MVGYTRLITPVKFYSRNFHVQCNPFIMTSKGIAKHVIIRVNIPGTFLTRRSSYCRCQLLFMSYCNFYTIADTFLYLLHNIKHLTCLLIWKKKNVKTLISNFGGLSGIHFYYNIINLLRNPCVTQNNFNRGIFLII